MNNNRYVLSAIIIISIFTILYFVLTIANIYINSIKCHKCSLHGVKENYTNLQLSIAAEEAKQKEASTRSGSQDINPITANYFSTSYNTSYFDSNNYNTQYHDSVDVIVAAGGDYGLPLGTVWVMDPYGNKVAMLDPKAKTNFTYYQPGTYSKYGSGNYVPSYTDSVYLSETLNFLRKSPYAR